MSQPITPTTKKADSFSNLTDFRLYFIPAIVPGFFFAPMLRDEDEFCNKDPQVYGANRIIFLATDEIIILSIPQVW